MSSKPIHFSGLNGLRAIAALAVVVSHITLALKDFNLNPYIFGKFHDGTPMGISLAGYGVNIFFVLSGFLITYLLQKEKDLQPIAIKKFYLRRAFRIFPLYYLFIVFVLITMWVLNQSIVVESWLFYILYLANIPYILNNTVPILAHYWSLGVEEQFYLFWPWVNKYSNKLILIISLAICGLIGVKLTLHFIVPNTILESAIHVTRFHCMLIGALGALLYKSNNLLFLKIADNRITQLICWFVLILTAINRFHIASVIDNEIISVVGLFLIIGQVNIKNRLVNLDNSLMDFLGKISYGIYVLHPLVILLISKSFLNTSMPEMMKYIVIYLVITGATILAAFVSYRYFESYFLKLKKKFEVVKSSPNRVEKAIRCT